MTTFAGRSARPFAGTATMILVALLLGASAIDGASAASSTEKFVSVADAFAREDTKAEKTGDLSRMTSSGQNGDRKRAYVKFFVPDRTARLATKAKLQLFAMNDGPGVGVYATRTSDWDEESVSWSDQPWWDGSDGAIDRVDRTSAGKWVSFDVTSSFRQDGTRSFAVVVPRGVDGDAIFATKEGANSPRLILTRRNSSTTTTVVQTPTTSLTTTTAVRPGPTTTTTPAEPVSGTSFGMSVKPNAGETNIEAHERLNMRVGGLEMSRYFFQGAPGDLAGLEAVHSGAISVSFKLKPKSVLSGQHDLMLRSWFSSLPNDRDVWWTYFHEPEDQVESGYMTAADYRAAWNHIIALSKEAKKPRVKSALILMSFDLKPGANRNWRDYYPGAAVDIVAWDAYSRIDNGTYENPATLYGPAIAASRSVGKPFAIAETASGLLPGDPNGTGRAAWMLEVGKYLSSEGAVFVSYFNSNVGDGTDYRLHDEAGLDAWKKVIDQY